MRRAIVWKFVSVPPSQRVLTKGMPQRSASLRTISRDCFFVPTKSTASPADTDSRICVSASSRRRTVCERSRMWMPLRSVKMKGRMRGFQRRVWWPKWTSAPLAVEAARKRGTGRRRS